MTVNEIRKYVEERGYPRGIFSNMIARLEAEYKDSEIDTLTSLQICNYIDEQSEHWKGFYKFLNERREERIKRKDTLSKSPTEEKTEE